MRRSTGKSRSTHQPRTNPSLTLHSQSPSTKPESPTNTCRVCPLTPIRFHVLLNSLFKVLFNFPSRYLFAIGLVVIFSLRWSLPPTLGCTLKQPDSTAAPTDTKGVVWALHPLWAMAPLKGTLTASRC